jgi:hypothetical protein
VLRRQNQVDECLYRALIRSARRRYTRAVHLGSGIVERDDLDFSTAEVDPDSHQG